MTRASVAKGLVRPDGGSGSVQEATGSPRVSQSTHGVVAVVQDSLASAVSELPPMNARDALESRTAQQSRESSPELVSNASIRADDLDRMSVDDSDSGDERRAKRARDQSTKRV